MMSTQIRTHHTHSRSGAGAQACDNPVPDICKDKWLQKYARRIHRLWLQWQTPLGVAPAYTRHIRQVLNTFYEDPLKRKFIETTY